MKLKEETYILLEDCRHGYLYEVKARSFTYSVYDNKYQGFVGIRQKFNFRFLELEYHWDTGSPYGTVKPLKLLKECPIKKLEISGGNKKLFDWLENEIKILGDNRNGTKIKRMGL